MNTREKKRMRRRHRQSARWLLTNGGLMNSFSAPGSTFWNVAQWHLNKARNIRR